DDSTRQVSWPCARLPPWCGQRFDSAKNSPPRLNSTMARPFTSTSLRPPGAISETVATTCLAITPSLLPLPIGEWAGVRGSRILDSPSGPHPARFARHPLPVGERGKHSLGSPSPSRGSRLPLLPETRARDVGHRRAAVDRLAAHLFGLGFL